MIMIWNDFVMIIFNTLRPRQNGHHFLDNIFKYIFLNENAWILINSSMKFVPKGPISNIPSVVQMHHSASMSEWNIISNCLYNTSSLVDSFHLECSILHNKYHTCYWPIIRASAVSLLTKLIHNILGPYSVKAQISLQDGKDMNTISFLDPSISLYVSSDIFHLTFLSEYIS